MPSGQSGCKISATVVWVKYLHLALLKSLVISSVNQTEPRTEDLVQLSTEDQAPSTWSSTEHLAEPSTEHLAEHLAESSTEDLVQLSTEDQPPGQAEHWPEQSIGPSHAPGTEPSTAPSEAPS